MRPINKREIRANISEPTADDTAAISGMVKVDNRWI